MKKIMFFLITLISATSIALANPISANPSSGIIIDKIIDNLGIYPAICIEVVFLLVMLGVAICLSLKSLDVKNKPENKKSFVKIVIVILIVTIISGYFLINETIHHESPSMSGPFEML